MLSVNSIRRSELKDNARGFGKEQRKTKGGNSAKTVVKSKKRNAAKPQLIKGASTVQVTTSQEWRRPLKAERKLIGPRGLLLVGFSEEDVEAVQQWFASMEPGFRISSCSDNMLGQDLTHAITASHGTLDKQTTRQSLPELVPRVAIFSGMTDEETIGIAQFWNVSGVREPIFSSVVESALRKPLRTVLADIARAYVTSKAPAESVLDANELKKLLRRKIAGKSRSGKSSIQGPIVIKAEGNSAAS